MMSRLEEIKQHQWDGYTIWDMSEDDLIWLIKQAERVKELEEENAGLHDILEQVEYQEKDKLLAENKRYKQALEFYADYENHVQYRDLLTDSGLSDSKIRLDNGDMARQALEGED